MRNTVLRVCVFSLLSPLSLSPFPAPSPSYIESDLANLSERQAVCLLDSVGDLLHEGLDSAYERGKASEQVCTATSPMDPEVCVCTFISFASAWARVGKM